MRALGPEGKRATLANVLLVCAGFGLAREKAARGTERIRSQVAHGWLSALSDSGVVAIDRARLACCFAASEKAESRLNKTRYVTGQGGTIDERTS